MPEAWAQPWKDVASSLGVDVQRGLSAPEIDRRRALYGTNRLRQQPRRSIVSILVAQLRSLIIALLVTAAVVAFAFGDSLEGWAVVLVIVLNTVIGFFSELGAVRSMEALFALGSVTTRVVRDAEVRMIPAVELVPGDLVSIEAGDVVTADLRLVEASKLQADESALTGESLPVAKQVPPVATGAPLAERRSMLFKGTSMTRGAGTGIVVATGMGTELGEISALVAAADEVSTPLEKRLEQLGQRLIGVTLAITSLVVLSGVWTGKDLILMIETGLALAVAAIPEGLPIVATIALARGLRRMARRHALINRLASVETLGATSVICTDKTGTLTENRMTVSVLALADGTVELRAGDGGSSTASFQRRDQPVDPLTDDLLRAALETAALCNNAGLPAVGEGGDDGAVGDPLEVALLVAAAAAGLRRETLLADLPEVREVAFDADDRRMATFHRDGGHFRVAVKGAPESVLATSSRLWGADGGKPMDDGERQAWQERNEALAADGLRVLALAGKRVDSVEAAPYDDLAFLGLVGLVDPPRRDVRQAIEQCHRAGIDVVMVTGDQAVTAAGIARQVGVVADENPEVVLGSAMKPLSELSPEEQQKLLQAHILARVNPRQKLDLIELHQRAGHVVAMTGDGVNDAPALKKADIGIAMGKRGTQVAQEAADMVLRDDAFSTIVAAVAEGRAIFANIRTFVLYLMSCNVSEVMVVALAALLGTSLPILPLQILFLNLVTDVFPALALGMGSGDPRQMEQPPRGAKEPILGRPEWWQIGFYGVIFTCSVLGALLLAEHWLGMGDGQAVTVSFLTLAFAQLWHVFNMRAAQSPVLRNEISRNPFVWAALALCVVLLLLAVHWPVARQVLEIEDPGMAGWFLVLGMSLVPLVCGQLLKAVVRRRG